MKCPNCGTEVNGKFCPNCGTKIQDQRNAVINVIKRILQWSATAFLALLTFSFFINEGGFLSGLLFLILTIIVSPLRKMILPFLPEICRKTWISVALGTVLFVTAVAVFPSSKNEDIADSRQVTATESSEVTESAKEEETQDLLKAETNEVESTRETDIKDKKSDVSSKDKSVDRKGTQNGEVKKFEATTTKNATSTRELPTGTAEPSSVDSGVSTSVEGVTNAEAKAEEPKVEEESDERANPTENTTTSDNVGSMSEQAATPEAAPESQETNDQNDTTEQSGDGSNFNTYNNPELQNTDAAYVLNTNSHVFHYPHCSSVKTMSESNYATSSASRDEIIAQGYKPCGRCHP